MLALSPESSQNQLNKLGQFCNEWGIEVNEIKTQVMILGQTKNIAKQNVANSNLNFNLLGKDLRIVDSYCYLGILVTKTGEFRTAQKCIHSLVHTT